MKKNEQIEVNTYVENIVNDITALLRTSYAPIKWDQLYRCSADICAVGDWILLRSYSTIVAAYNVNTQEMFDFLRLVYGYTATSTKHIAKFRNYCRDEFGIEPYIYRWHAVYKPSDESLKKALYSGDDVALLDELSFEYLGTLELH